MSSVAGGLESYYAGEEFAAVIQRRGLDGLLPVLQVKTQPALAETG